MKFEHFHQQSFPSIKPSWLFHLPSPLTYPSRNKGLIKPFYRETNGFHKALLRVNLLVDQSPWKKHIIKSPRIKSGRYFRPQRAPTAGSGGHLATGTAHRTWVAWRRWLKLLGRRDGWSETFEALMEKRAPGCCWGYIQGGPLTL